MLRTCVLPLLLLLLTLPRAVAAQASAYIPLDDPDLPLIEHLIARGDIDDPSPMVRPFREADAERVLAAADTTGAPSRDLIQRLRARFAPAETPAWWRGEARAGFQTYTHARRDPLHPAGDGGIQPYADVMLRAGFGSIVAVTRPAIEQRVQHDPDWTSRQGLSVTGRMVEAYVSAQTRYVHLAYGQMDHNWGPVGLPGIPLSNYGYERQGLMLEFGTSAVRLTALASDLRDQTDSIGQLVHRYYFAHRLSVRASDRFQIAAWETNVLAGPGRAFETRYRNPLSVGYLANTLGVGDRGNEMLGLDLQWRPWRRTTLEAQFALDDFWYQNRNQNRDRWALTLGASGPLGRAAAWRALYTQVSSLAFRAFNPQENLADAGVGIGRNFSDMDLLLLRVSLPLENRWLVTPELALQRQGEGAINTPYPAAGPDREGTPALFIGTVERTYRIGMGLQGSWGPLALAASGGFHHIINRFNVPGNGKDRFEARLQATLGIGRGGALPGDGL
jgi:hypothetical protein